MTRTLKDTTETMAQKQARWWVEASEVIDPSEVQLQAVGRLAADDPQRTRAVQTLPLDLTLIGWEPLDERLARVVAGDLTERLTSWDRTEWVATAAEYAPDWLSAERLHTVVGPAGAGKTTTITAVAATAQAAGIPLRTLAVAQRVAGDLGKNLGLGDDPAQNITRYLGQDQDQTGAHIIAVGDPNQTGSVGPGGMFEVMVTEPDTGAEPEIPNHRLGRIWRMREHWERQASLGLRDGNAAAVDAYLQRGRVCPGDEILVTAATNRQVDWLNDRLQEQIIDGRDPNDEKIIT